MILLDIKLPHYHNCSYSIQRSSGHHDASSTPCTHPHRPTTRSWPQADFSTYAWLWCRLKPNNSTNLANFGLSRGLVKMSDMLSSISTYFTCIFPSSTASQMKWYHRLMCSILTWNLLSFASMMAPWLLHEMVSGFSSPPQISFIKLLSQIPSLAACVCAMYSASVLDSNTTPCFLELQESTSQKHSIMVSLHPLKVSQRSFMLPR